MPCLYALYSFQNQKRENSPGRAVWAGNYITAMFIVLLEAEVEFCLELAELVAIIYLKLLFCSREIEGLG